MVQVPIPRLGMAISWWAWLCTRRTYVLIYERDSEVNGESLSVTIIQ